MIAFALTLNACLLTTALSAQEVSGKVVLDSATTILVKIENSTQGHSVYTTETGEFNIKAQLRDTLIFSNLFIQTRQIIVDHYILQHPAKIRLYKKRFGLNEVVINAEGRDTLDVKQYQQDFQNQLTQDMQKRYHLYHPSHGNIGNLVLFGFRKLKALFGGEAKEAAAYIPSIIADDLENLFTKDDPLFNNNLLQNTLKIPPEKTYLFFIYCEDHRLSGTLLQQDHRFQLLDKLVELAEEF